MKPSTQIISSIIGATTLLFSSMRMADAESLWRDGEEPAIREVVAVIHPPHSRAPLGVVRFAITGDALTVRVEIGGLLPSRAYSLRIHEFGDCSARDSSSAGQQYGEGLSVLASFETGVDGWTDLHFSHRGYSLTAKLMGNSSTLLGRSVVVHDEDKRVACGTIGVATASAVSPPIAPDRD